MAQEKKNGSMYPYTSRGRPANISNQNSENINDTSFVQKTNQSTKDNISLINNSKNKNESNKKKAITAKNRTKNINLNFNYKENGFDCTNYKALRKDSSDNNIKSFKNQNITPHKYSQKSYSNNSKQNKATEITLGLLEPQHTTRKYPAVIPPPVPTTISRNNCIEDGNNFNCTSNQRHAVNFITYQPHLSNFNPNQCCQQVNLEIWGPVNLQISHQAKNIKNIDLKLQSKNSNPVLTRNVTPTNIAKACSNLKQQIILKNKFPTRIKSVNSNGYLNSDSNYPPPLSSNQHVNRIKIHQNHHNLTYVITEKENSTIPASENKITQSGELANLKLSNEYSPNKISGIISENNITRQKTTSNASNTFSEVPNSKNDALVSNNLTECKSGLSNSNSAKNTFSEHVIQNQSQSSAFTQIFPSYVSTAQNEPENTFNMHNYSFLQQNFTYVDTKANCNMINIYSPYKFLHQTEPHGIYMNDTLSFMRSPKKIQKRYFPTKKSWFPPLQSFQIPENTPPDRFLAKSHLMEIKIYPKNLLKNSKWDNLSSEIWHKFLIHQQKEITYRKKVYLWKYLYLSIKRNFPRYGLYLVGSTITGFGTNSSDVDLCLVHRASFSLDSRFEAISHLNNIQEYLKTLDIFEQFHLIEAKVPILRFCDLNNLIEVDLNFNNSVGIRNTHLLYCYAQLDWRLRPLALTIKLWARYHNINNAKTMTISSYSLVLMIIHFLQFGVNPPVLPCLHEMYPEKFNIILTTNEFGFVDMIEEIGPYKSDNTETLGELFLQFLQYYSNFDYSKYAISVRTGKLLPVEECRNAQSLKNDVHQWRELCIEEPFDLTNTARSVYDCETFDKIKHIFIRSWQILENTLELNRIFEPLHQS